MSEHAQDLIPLTALGATDPRSDHVGPLTLTENPNLALASVAARRGQETVCQAQLSKLLGGVPGPGETLIAEETAGFWISPESWMLSAPLVPGEDFTAHLQALFGGSASITEQTDAWVIFDLSGDGVDRVMELLCPVDLRRQPDGFAQRTSIHHMGCFVIRLTPASCLRILGPRSSAGSLHHALLAAMHAAL